MSLRVGKTGNGNYSRKVTHKNTNREGQNMSKENPGVIVLDTHEHAENAIKELEHAGFDLKKLSIIGKDYHTEENVVGYYNIADRME